MTNRVMLQGLALAIGFAGVAACASYPAPSERMASSEAAIRGAQEVGASSNPQAQLHLKLAEEQVGHAKTLMRDGENQRADYLLMRAASDAELALALARESTMEAQAQQATDQVKTLKSKGAQ